MKVKEFRGVKIGDKGYKISYAFNGQGLHIMEGIVHNITDFGKIIDKVDHSITLRSEFPCDEEHRVYMDSFGYNYVEIDRKIYPLSFGCYLYSEDNSTCSFFARNKQELEEIKEKVKKRAIKFATQGF